MRIITLAFTFMLISLSVAQAASNKGLIYTGRILRPDGSPLESSRVEFLISIYSPGSEECVLYQETQAVNMTGSMGAFSLKVGEGTRVAGYLASQMELVFQNDTPFTGLTCVNGSSFDPTASINNTDRLLKVSFRDGTNNVSLAPQEIRAVPYSLQAKNASRAVDVTGTANIRSLILRNASNNQINITAPASFTNFSLVLPNALPSSGQTGYMVVNSSGEMSFNTANLGSGTVTSVNVAVPTYMSSSGGPVTSSGTINLGFNPQSPATVFAAPVGSTGAPSFRALLAADIPDISADYIKVGATAGGDLSGTYPNPTVSGLRGRPLTITSLANNHMLQFNGTDWVNRAVPTCSANQYLTFNGTTWSCATDTGSAGMVSSVTASAPLSQTGTTGSVTVGLNYATGNFDVNGTNQLAIKTGGVGATELASTTVTAGSYGSATSVPNYTVDADGRLTAASSTAIALSPSAVSAAGSANHVAIYNGSGVLTSEARLAVSRGGTNSSTALNNNRIMVSSGGAIVEAGALTNGQLLIGSTGAAPVAATLTGGGGVTVTNAAGSITLGANTSVLQARVSGTCAAGSSIRTINVDGTVVCQTDNVGTSPGDAGYGGANKGIVAFDTNEASSGINVTGGIARIAFTPATPGSYGSATTVPNITIDSFGRVVALSENTIVGGGDVSGTVNNLTVNRIRGTNVSITSLANNNMLQYNGTNWVNRAIPTCSANQYLTFNGTAWSCATDVGASGVVSSISASAPLTQSGSSGAVTLGLSTSSAHFEVNGSNQLALKTNSVGANELSSTTVSAGSYGSATSSASFAVDADGRLTAATAIPIALSPSAVSAAGSANHVAIYNASGVLSSEAALSVSRGGTATTSFAANKIVATNGTGTALTSFSCASGEVIKFNASGNAVCGTDETSAGGITGTGTANRSVRWASATALNNGGINDTSDAVAINIDSNENVGIGTAPSEKLDVAGNIRSSGELISTNANSLRMVQGNYGAFYRNDGVDLYTMITANGSPYGSWGSLRPFTINLTSGNVTMGNGALSVIHGGNVSLGSAPTAASHATTKAYVDNAISTGSVSNADTTDGFHLNQNVTTGGSPTFVSVYTGSWFRSTGDTGWFSQNHGGGIYMTDSSYVRVYNNKSFWSDANINTTNNLSIGTGTPDYRAKLRVHSGGIGIGSNSSTIAGVGHAIEMQTDNTFGGVHDSHTGIRMFAYDMNGWGTSKLGIQVGNGWATYVGGNTPAKTDMAMVVGQAETLVSGNLGVGVGATGAKLHVNGNMIVDNILDNNGNFHLDSNGGNSIYLNWFSGSGGTRIGNGGGGYGNAFAAAYYLASDRRYKKDIHQIEDGLSKVLALRGVTYKWIHNNENEVGVIAQEVEKVFPELVDTDENGKKSVKYSNLVAPLIESTRELYGMSKMQESQIAKIKEMIRLSEERQARAERNIASVQSQVSAVEKENISLREENKKLRSELELIHKDMNAIKKKLGL